MDRESFRHLLLEGLGGEWPTGTDLEIQVSKVIDADGYSIECLSYQSEPDDWVPAYLLIPSGVSAQRPAPGIAVWHQHAGQYHLGKSEPAGLAGNPMHHTGVALARAGYVVICPDALCFEERRDQKLKDGDYERFEFLKYVVNGQSLAWKNILDMKRAIDLLSQRPEVLSDRLGCYGHSMGATHTWLVGPWDERLKCLVGNCCLPTYEAVHRHRLLHCFPNFIPRLGTYGDTPDIAGLIAPRPLHLNFGELDGGSPIEEVKQAVGVISEAYAQQNASDKFSYYIEAEVGHILSSEMWKRTKEWFDRHLLPN